MSIFLSALRDQSVKPQAHRSPMEVTREEETTLLSTKQCTNTVILLLCLKSKELRFMVEISRMTFKC